MATSFVMVLMLAMLSNPKRGPMADVVDTPEIDASSMASAMTLLVGGVLTLTGRDPPRLSGPRSQAGPAPERPGRPSPPTFRGPPEVPVLVALRSIRSRRQPPPADRRSAGSPGRPGPDDPAGRRGRAPDLHDAIRGPQGRCRRGSWWSPLASRAGRAIVDAVDPGVRRRATALFGGPRLGAPGLRREFGRIEALDDTGLDAPPGCLRTGSRWSCFAGLTSMFVCEGGPDRLGPPRGSWLAGLGRRRALATGVTWMGALLPPSAWLELARRCRGGAPAR